MLCSKIVKYISTGVFLVLFAPSFASNNNHAMPVVIISSGDTSLAKSAAHNAYKLITRIDKPIIGIQEAIFECLSKGEFPAGLHESNSKFQAKKYKLEKILQKSKLNIGLLFLTEITIDILNDGHGNHLMFHLPTIKFDDLFMSQIDTVENANATISVLTDLITKIDGVLPSDTSYEALVKFTNPEATPQIDSNDFSRLTMTHTEDSQTILTSLVELKGDVIDSLNTMLNLAKIAASGKHSNEEMDKLHDAFGYQVSSFMFNTLFNPDHISIGKINVFNDVTLNFQMAGKVHEYFFPKVDLASLKLDTDISNLDDLITYVEHLSLALNWIGDWIVTGNTPLPRESETINHSNVLSSGRLDPQTLALIRKNLPNL
ncbi:hypothetical protein [Legionella spiritensis]|uniref:Uncharacterized protein n=1 Tax=Legionella spiritensis TaxID=452 RepID=A0A0W0Z9U9_LEGSP|nr:hypothetical protein [Legionella spiritensis]KTD65890.1 hypothetical protein Lspi_0309 [Legionella spiritensis]SNV32017.1 Uncharacterised protein [Legionella spiritensis]